MLPYSDDMTFAQRMYNAVVTAYDWIVRRFVYIPAEEALVKKHFSHLEPLPSLDELVHNVSLNFVNTHRALAPPRPAMPGISKDEKRQINAIYYEKTEPSLHFIQGTISIGGAHIKKGSPLPTDLQQFLDESKNGVIYFSLGTVVKSSKLPEGTIAAFLSKIFLFPRPAFTLIGWEFQLQMHSNI